MPKALVTILGKSIRSAARLRGGGSALPGLVVEKISPDYVATMLAGLPKGVVVISGTNGKTTTAKIVSELLTASGLKVFTNSSGSNFKRGVAASLLAETKINGKLHADIAVLELDEAHAVNFVKEIKPDYSLILNVMRDQLDRYGEIDTTAQLLSHIVAATKKVVVLNREDKLIADLNKYSKSKTVYFGVNPALRSHFPNDNELHSDKIIAANPINSYISLEGLSGKTAAYNINNKLYGIDLELNGIYNALNAAAAMTLVSQIIDISHETLINHLAKIRPAFGRGESLKYKGKNIELVLVKNPAGFRLGLQSFDNNLADVMIAINDDYADGRDVSWLWDVDFRSLSNQKPFISGRRCYDMALRLSYDNVDSQFINSDIRKTLKALVKTDSPNVKRIYCTYTAMLTIRHAITKGRGLREI